MFDAPFAVAAFLIAWCALGIALVRRAEYRVAFAALPPAWREIAIGLGVAVLAVSVRPAPTAAACGVACIALVVASGADARTGLLLDAVTFPAAVLVASLAIAHGNERDAAWGVAFLVGVFGTIVVASRGRYMGLGDVKAMYAIGAAFGPFESLVVIFVACASGIVAASLRGALARGAEIRFAPHLAIGSVFALVAGDAITHRYLGF